MEEKSKASDPEGHSSKPSGSSIFSRPIAGLPGFTIRVLIIGFGVLLFSTVVSTLSLSVTAVSFTIPLILMLFIEFILSKFSKRFQLSIQEWAVYFTVGTGLGSYAAISIATVLLPSLNASVATDYAKYIPNFWSIPAEKATAGLYVGTKGSWISIIRAIPWGDWTWPLIYWYIFIVTLYLAGFFLITILRKQWVEVERLAFPGTVATYEIIKRAKEHERPSLWSFQRENLWFLGGFFIGFGIYIPDVLQAWGLLTLPTTGQYMGWYRFNLVPYLGNVLPGASLGPDTFAFISFLLPVAVFAPMDVLATAILCDLIFRVILPPVLIGAGVLSGGADPTRPEWVYGVSEGPRWALIDFMGLSGFTYGLGFFLLAFQWRRIKDTLVAAVRGTKREEGETFSWRLTWIGFFVCSIIWIYLVTICNVPLVMALVVWGFITCWFVFVSRFMAEMATWINESALQTPVITDIGARLGYWTTPGLSQQGFNTNLTFATVTDLPKDIGIMPSTGMTNYKIGDMTETSPRSIGLTWIIMTLVWTAFGLVLWMFVLYRFGFGTLTSRGVWEISMATTTPISRTLTGVQQTGWWYVDIYPYIIGGAVLSGVLLYLRTVFPWFFLNPIGVWAGISPLCAQWRLMFIIGFVLKYLTLKIGGAKAYEKFLVPLIVGYAIGLGSASFILVPPRLLTLLKTV